MSRLRAAMTAHAEALDAVNRTLAAQCESDARAGIFHPIGHRCAWCAYSLPDGCSLRLAAKNKAPS